MTMKCTRLDVINPLVVELEGQETEDRVNMLYNKLCDLVDENVDATADDFSCLATAVSRLLGTVAFEGYKMSNADARQIAELFFMATIANVEHLKRIKSAN